MVEENIKAYRYSMMICQRAKDGQWIADEVKVKSDIKEELEGMLTYALNLAKKKVDELNKKE